MNKVIEQVLQTIAVNVDNTQVSQLGYIKFAINLLVNALTYKEPFELVYGTNVPTVVDQLDGVYPVENDKQLAIYIETPIAEAREQLKAS